jgi:hypothetical protein
VLPDMSYVVETIPQITRDVLCTKSYKGTYPSLRVKQYTPPAQMKNTSQILLRITYAQITKQISYTPTNIEREHTQTKVISKPLVCKT